MKAFMPSICFFLLLLILSPVQCRIVNTTIGALNGDQIGLFHMFKKVPFARPPLGKLRFQKPLPPFKWQGIWDATAYGPACMSNSSVTGSPQKWVDEDCLHLNIFTSDKCLSSKDCAVIVYLHGGGLEYDSSVMFNDTVIRDAFVYRDVVLVIPGVRLGIFSHFVVQNQSIAPSNLALYDIIRALEFTRDEIQAFGGNPKKITLLGHSYGGSIASMMHFSPRMNQDLSLFQQTIVMSSNHDFETLEAEIEKARRFGEHAGCLPKKMTEKMTTDEVDLHIMNCLQEKSGMELLRLQRELEDLGYPGYNSLIMREPLFKEVKYSKFMDHPKKIPMLIGCTRYEHDHEIGEYFYIGEGLDFDNKKEVEERYQKDQREGNYDFEGHENETQAIMVHTKVRVNKMLANKVPVYLYEYTYPKHAKHTDDLFYLLGVHKFEKDENEQKLTFAYRHIFTEFAKTGYPGFRQTSAEDDSYFDVFTNGSILPQMKANFEKGIMNYWLKDMVAYDKSITAQKLRRDRALGLPINNYDTDTPYFFKYLPFILVASIFIAGCLVGRCFWPVKKNYYIRLDGNDGMTYNYPVEKQF